MSNERTDRLVLAIEKYNTSNLSYKDVAELYDVPISTMRRHVVGITKTFKRSFS
jgi:predicted HTH domain antitoxin